MKTVSFGSKQTYKNLLLNIIAFIVQFAISFYISPVIVGGVGASAYGFIGVANDFVSYASIIATVFNSVASRFIANSFYKGDYKKANSYFNSLIATNIVISAALAATSIMLIPLLDRILTIPVTLVLDVQITFALVFASYIVSLLTLVFTTSTFITNRTDINGVRNIIQYIIRFALIVLFLNFVSVKIYWVACATLIATVVVAFMNIRLTKRLTPELSIDIKKVKKKYVVELAMSGSWMALTSISTILLRGLDLTIANMMIGDYEMGILSIARTMPNNITSIISVLAPLFTPAFIALYAKNKIEEIVRNVNESIKTIAMILFVPICGFIVFSYDFYVLWQDSLSQDEILLVTILSVVTVVQAIFNSTTSTMAQLSVVVNKFKFPVFVSLGCGIFSIIAEILLIRYTDLGLYGIVIPTTIVMVLRYVLFNSWYAGYCLKTSCIPFVLTTLKTWLSIPILIAFMALIRNIMPINSWMDFFVDIIVCGFVGYTLMVLIYGRKVLLKIVKRIKR